MTSSNYLDCALNKFCVLYYNSQFKSHKKRRIILRGSCVTDLSERVHFDKSRTHNISLYHFFKRLTCKLLMKHQEGTLIGFDIYML